MNSSSSVRLQESTPGLDDQLLSAAAAADNASILDDETEHIKTIGFDIYFYSLSLFIIPVGVVCNLFSICVFITSPTFRSNSTAQFLIALLITDCLVLSGDFLRCLSMRNPQNGVYYTGLTFVDTSNFGCKFVYYWRQSCKLLSAWITVAITMERLIAVVKPHKVASLSTTRRARLVVVSLTLICFVLAAFPLWTVGSKLYEDSSEERYVFATCVVEATYWTWLIAVVVVMTLAVPHCILVSCTIVIIVCLARADRFRRNSADSISSTSSIVIQRQLTVMLVIICCAAICLQLPYTVLYLLYYEKDSLWPEKHHKLLHANIFLSVKVADVFATANYALNFALYCVSGSAFRDSVRRLCRPRRQLWHYSTDRRP